MMVNIRRVLGKRWLSTLVLTGICCVFIYQYRQLDNYPESSPTNQERPGLFMDRVPALDLSKVLTEDRVYNESVLAKIRELVEETKDYSKVGSRDNTLTPAPKGIADRVDRLLEHKTGLSYIEIGIGKDEESDLINWLEKSMNWSGLILEPSVQIYNEGMSERSRAKVFRSCIEVGNHTWHHSRKPAVLQDTHCFPLGAVVKAVFGDTDNPPALLAVNTDGQEHDILGAFPFKTIKVKVVLIALRGALTDTTDFHRLMDIHGYKAILISNNHALGRTYIILERKAMKT